MIRLTVAFALVLSACSGVATVPTLSTPAASGAVPDDLAPGRLDVRTMRLADGTDLTYGLVLPEGFDPAADYPVLLAFPPGDQGPELMELLAEGTYLPEALARGWVVLAPAAPDGVLFFQGSERSVAPFLDALEWIRPEGGRIHIAGVSNGGISAFRVAGEMTDRVASIAVFPGYPSSAEDRAALGELAAVPVAMWVGADDVGWFEPMDEARRILESAGGTVEFDVRPGEGHILRSMSDGADLFDFLESARP